MTAVVVGELCLCASYNLFPYDKALVNVDKGVGVISVSEIRISFAVID